jgi:hypothetical protein
VTAQAAAQAAAFFFSKGICTLFATGLAQQAQSAHITAATVKSLAYPMENHWADGRQAQTPSAAPTQPNIARRADSRNVQNDTPN